MTTPLHVLRRRLTFWYVGGFASILLGFAVVLYGVVAWQNSLTLDRSLVATVEAADRLVTQGQGDVSALIQMLTPGRRIWVQWEGEPMGGPSGPGEAWVADALRRSFRDGEVRVRFESEDDRTWRLYSRTNFVPGGRRVAVAAGADVLEIENEYPGLIMGFLLAGLSSLLLVAVGGWRLARTALEPVDLAFAQMRRFMADAAHELRTPLAVLRGHADVARQRPREADFYVRTLSDISREASRMGDIVEQLLLLARADAGDWPIAREPLFLDDVLLDVAHAGGALGASRQVRVEVGQVDEAAVEGDAALLRQLLMALVDNAVKYSPDGGIVRVALVASDASCSVHVTDQGPGIAPDIRPHVFERFYRGDPARRRQSGAGLGLPIAAWIADLHGGRIAVDPGIEKGARVTLTLAVATRLSG